MPQSEAVARQAEALTLQQKQEQNRQAALVAAAITAAYLRQVDPASPPSVQQWVDLAVRLLIQYSDNGARSAAAYAAVLRRLEVPNATPFTPRAALGRVDEGVSSPLLLAGPYDYMNRIAQAAEAGPEAIAAAKQTAKEETAKEVAGQAVRFAQMGARQTIFDVSQQDAVALGWVRVTSDDSQVCWFCAMLASRGLQYRAFREGAFEDVNENFEGTGTAKVHNRCRCHLKPVYFETDKRVQKTEEYAELWSAFTTGDDNSPGNLKNFRIGYNHLIKTGEMLDIEDILKRRRAA